MGLILRRLNLQIGIASYAAVALEADCFAIVSNSRNRDGKGNASDCENREAICFECNRTFNALLL